MNYVLGGIELYVRFMVVLMASVALIFMTPFALLDLIINAD